MYNLKFKNESENKDSLEIKLHFQSIHAPEIMQSLFVSLRPLNQANVVDFLGLK
jgi:hypothetical protein